MSELDDSFAKLLGRQPSDTERQNLYRVKDALGVGNNDAIWLILMALEHYRSLYSGIPKRINEYTLESLKQYKEMADILSNQSAESIQESVSIAAQTAINDAAKKVARTLTRRDKLKFVCTTIVLAVLAFAGFGWQVHHFGQTAGYGLGYGAGYSEAKNETAAAAWANTPDGQLAYRLAQNGELHKLTKCTGKGWFIKDGNCFPHDVPGEGTYGWVLP